MKFVWILMFVILMNVAFGYCWSFWSSDEINSKNLDEKDKLRLKRASNDNEDEDGDYDSDNGDNGDNGGNDDDSDDNADVTTERVTPDIRYVDPRLRQPQQTVCNRQQYRCHYSGVCIDSNLVCNGHSDCLHGDDERECATIAKSNSQCSPQEFQCQGTPIRCINTASVCDGTYHCQYGDDEANCNDRNVQDIRANQQQSRPNIPERDVPRPQPQPISNEEIRPNIPERDIPRPQPQPRPANNVETQVQSRPSIPDRDVSRQQPRPTNIDVNSSKDRRLADDYIQKLEWRDRCVRSCLRY